MGLTGVIYAAIVVAWAAYLVPLALRRHDEAARNHSVERFSSTMRVLSRRADVSATDRVVVTPPRPVDRVLSPTLARRPSDAAAPAPALKRSRAAQRAAAARRRWVLGLLLVATAGVGVASAFLLLPWWSFGIPLALVLIFLVVARRQVRRAEDAYWLAAVQHSPAPSNVARRSPVRVDASAGVAKSAGTPGVGSPGHSPEHSAAHYDDEPTVVMSAQAIAAAAAAAEERVEAVALTTSDGGSLWDPLPITLPTYVSKPTAGRTIRTINLGEPGVSSAGHDADDSRVAASVSATKRTGSPPADEPVVAPPRAANG